MAIDLSQIPKAPPEDAPIPAARESLDTLTLLAQRRSAKTMLMAKPGPSDAQLETLLRIAARAPDHGKLAPWRFAIIAGEARARIGSALANVIAPDVNFDAGRLDVERNKFLLAPVCVMVVSTAAPHPKIPEWEQQLSAGAVCFNLLVAAHAMGFAGVWLTEWPAYDDRARPVLGLQGGERVAGFIHLGTPTQFVAERARPDMTTRISRL